MPPVEFAVPYNIIDLLTPTSFPHDVIKCKKSCTKSLECNHKCTEPCYLPCRCACNDDRGRSTVRTSSQEKSAPHSRHRPPRDPASLPPNGQAFRDFASGGHVAADATLDAMAANDISQLRLQKADDDMASALFGANTNNTADPHPTTLTKVSSAANGKPRGVWKTVFEGHEENPEQTKSEGQTSLLD